MPWLPKAALQTRKKSCQITKKIPGINEAADAVDLVRFNYWYATKNPQEMEKAFLNDKSPTGRQILSVAFIEEGRMTEAEQIESFAKSQNDGAFNDLTMAAAWLLQGDKEHASPWLERAKKTLDAEYDTAAKHAVDLLFRLLPSRSGRGGRLGIADGPESDRGRHSCAAASFASGGICPACAEAIQFRKGQPA